MKQSNKNNNISSTSTTTGGSSSNSSRKNNNATKKVPVAKVATTVKYKSTSSPNVGSKTKYTSSIDAVFGSNNHPHPHHHNNPQYNYRRHHGKNESSSTTTTATTGNYTKTKYQRLPPDHPPQHHPYHRSQQQQQQSTSHRPKKESSSPRTVSRRRLPPKYEPLDQYYSLKRPRPFHSSTQPKHHQKHRQQQQQKQSYSYPQSSTTSSAVSSKFYEMKLPDRKRIQDKETENSTTRASNATTNNFPCWMKVNHTTFQQNQTSTKKSPRKNAGVGDGTSIQDIIHHIRTFHVPTDDTDDVDNDVTTDSKKNHLRNIYNMEMNLLAQFIQLHPHEIQLRNQFVTQLEEQIIQQLPSSSSSSSISRTTQYCHIFGSFASIPICTFQSDLDIALFNVGIEGNYKTTPVTTTTIASTDTTVASTSTAITTTTILVDQSNNEEIAPNEIIILDDDEEKKKKKKPHLKDDTNHISTTESAKNSAAIRTKQQRKAVLVAKWKQALDQSSSTTAGTVAATTSFASTDDDDVIYHVDNDNVINIFNDSDFDTDSDDDHDSADPMNHFHQCDDVNDNDDKDVDEPHHYHDTNDPRGRKRAYSDSTILSMNSLNGGGAAAAAVASTKETMDDAMTVSFFASKPPPTSTTTMGPQGHVRIKVVALLATLCNKLRKKSISRAMQIQNVTFIKTARVPIIKIQLLSGFNVDIAVGGYGTDTSLYAAQQIQLYPNIFVPVVVLLKVLLAQHNLDEPYTGGLGSYKLYILIADHIYRHQQWCKDNKNGCRDSSEHIGPFEALFTFLYRYGYGGTDMQDRQVLQYPTTTLHQHRPVVCAIDGMTSADLSNVYKLQDCITLFRLCFHRLYQQILFLQAKQQQGSTQRPSQLSSSTLAHIICPFQLQSSRDRILQQTKEYASKVAPTHSSSSSCLTLGTANEGATRSSPTISSTTSKNNLPQQDRTRDEILAGYERVFC